MTDAFDEAMTAVLEVVEPTDAERQELAETVDRLLERTEAVVADLAVDADVLLVGSTARDTWLRGERDIDVFVRFPPDLPRADLQRHGLAVGEAVLPDGRKEFAEHPYVTGEFDGFGVDLVPCFRVERATEIRSAVDRTPFHMRYVREKLDASLSNQVRLLKQFCAAIDVYGSDLRTEGFSGYLTELLILEFGSFRGVVEAAADWQPPVRLDPEDHGLRSFDHPLVVVDPTDPERNVAAVLSEENVARFQHHSRQVLADPFGFRFAPKEPEPLDTATLESHLERRGTTAIAVRFEAPAVVDDQLYPQLRKSLAGVERELERQGFEVVRANAFADESAVLLFELATGTVPAVERHEGPPVSVREHAADFFHTYENADVYGPFLDGGRYVVERQRSHSSAVEFLRSEALFDAALGSDIVPALEAGYEVLVDDGVTDLCPEFAVALARYFEPRP